MYLLLEDISGLGKKFQVLPIEKEQAVDLMAKRLVLAFTPFVQKRYEGYYSLPPVS